MQKHRCVSGVPGIELGFARRRQRKLVLKSDVETLRLVRLEFSGFDIIFGGLQQQRVAFLGIERHHMLAVSRDS